jgi:hypothetical protein
MEQISAKAVFEQFVDLLDLVEVRRSVSSAK